MAYMATFSLTLSDGSTSTDIRLECQFGDSKIVGNKRRLKVIHYNWLSPPTNNHQYKPKQGNESYDGTYKRKGPLDVKVLDIAQNLAWQLEISSYSGFPDFPRYPKLNEFIQHVSLDVPLPSATDRDVEILPSMNFTNIHGLCLDSVCVKTKYQWFISITPYIFDVTKYEFYDTTRHSPEGVASTVKGITPDTRWGASLSSRDWTDRLGAQWSLPLGCRGTWKPSVNAFFSPTKVGSINDPLVNGVPRERVEWSEDGFKEFEGRINDCMELIVKARRNAWKRAQMAKRGVHEDDMD